MSEDLKFHFPIPTLLREGDLVVTAAEKNAGINPRLPAGHIAAGRALIGTVTGDVNSMKNKKGGVGTLTQEQNDQLDELNKWVSRAKQTATLAFKGQSVKLREQFQIGIGDHFDLGNIVSRANIILGNVKDAANLAALKARGWLDADTAALADAIAALTAAADTQEGGISGGLDATGLRNHDANALYDSLLTIQNAADLQWSADVPANAGTRTAFRLDVFPPRGGTPTPPPAPAPTPQTTAPPAK
jgi:alpha-D-ribose 1-methylphosphonate 5-triphosphate synthase subunit PhnG